MSNTPFSLIRYLFVLEVNTSFVWLPKWPAMELSLLLGETIADRLPIVEARAWKKSIAAWNISNSNFQQSNKKNEPNKLKNDNVDGKKLHQSPWPINAVIFWYPVKRSYGKGELILFELKLLGDAADHELFVEVILPAMEQISMTPYIGTKNIESKNSGSNNSGSKNSRSKNSRSNNSVTKNTNSLWGHFDIRSVYSAKGYLWRPILKNGRLDLRRKVNSTQWSSGLKPLDGSFKSLDQLTWISPFMIDGLKKDTRDSRKNNRIAAPKLFYILEAIAERMGLIFISKYSTAADFLNSLDNEERLAWKQAMEQSLRIPIYNNMIKESSNPIQGFGKGFQIFSKQIPDFIIPYLELGAIFHIGEYAHFGCGTYVIQ
ncbi:MAG: hypothetical protein HQK67_09060 [Desulfamplus sp.]|nr:hypothetical protein [Desulfamplus sp.]